MSNREPQTRRSRWPLGCVVLIAILVGVCFLPSMRSRVRYAREYTEAFLGLPERFTEVDPNELIVAYATDSVAADRKWAGESVSMRGIVLTGALRHKTDLRWTHVELINSLQPLQLGQPSVYCIMESPQSAPEELVGKLIHVTGVCQGIQPLSNGQPCIVVANCRIVP